MNPLVVFGPPGCGKTRTLMDLLGEELDRGVHPDSIAFVTFTRAARGEVQRRVRLDHKLSSDALPWLRTIHSTAFKLLALSRKQIMSDERWAEFAERHGYQFSRIDAVDLDEPLPTYPRRTEADVHRFAYDWARNLQLDPDRALGRCPVEGADSMEFQRYAQRLETFKTEHDLFDFVDILETALDGEVRPPVTVAFVDEAQDLSPLQIALVRQWFVGCDRVYVAGDDDQAIYKFQGADPSWLLDLAKRNNVQILGQSYRVPERVRLVAERLISRNKTRQPKEYLARNVEGCVQYWDADRAVESVDGSEFTFVLARNRIFLRDPAVRLIERGVPFLVEGPGAPCPLANRDLVAAVRVGLKLLDTGSSDAVPARDLEALLMRIPEGSGLYPDELRLSVTLARTAKESFSASDLLVDPRMQPLLHALRERGPVAVMSKVSSLDRMYLQKLLDTYGKIPASKVLLTSIHGSKGREAKKVVLLTEMTRATWNEFERGGQAGYESENRVFYVGATRAEETLILADTGKRRQFEFPRVPSAREAIRG